MSVAFQLLWNIVYTLTYIAFRILLAAVSALQRVWLPSSNGEDSCRLFRIIWRRKLFMIDVASPSDFLGIYERSVYPEYVLIRNVSLYCVTRDQAIFVETATDIDVHSSKINPFQYIAQFEHAIQFIEMPMKMFHKLSDEIGKPRMPVGYLANTGRCGSTILAQALENVPETLVHAEPDCLTNIGQMRLDKSMSTTDREKVLVSTINILCKAVKGVSRICIKPRSCAVVHMATISKNFPNIKIMFGYRNSRSTVSSFLGLMLSETVQNLSLYAINNDRFSEVLPFFRRKLHYYFVSALDKESPLISRDKMNAVEMFAYSWACSISIAQDHKKNGGHILPILYEDLVKDTRPACAEVLKALQIDLSYMEVALTAFRSDSQAGSPLSKDNIRNNDRRKITDSDKVRADKVLQKFGMPGLGTEFRL